MNKIELIEKFMQSVVIHRNQSQQGDYTTANKHFKKAETYYLKIKELDDNWVNEFEKLLEHEKPSVRVSVAYYLLPYKTKLAIKTLKKLRNEPDGVGFNAKIVLKEWKNGHLKFPELNNGKIIYKYPLINE